jgi:homopolymeric O-antigen transport system ATP-binding protein
MSELAISARGLGKRYRVGQIESGAARFRRFVKKRGPQQALWAIRDLTFDVGVGEAFGVIGRNGAGKSTLLKVLSRITEPTAGHVDVRGRVGALLEVGTGFHPELTGRENVYLNASLLGMTTREVDRRLDQIVEFAGVERHIDTPVKWYSSGMYVRLAFAVAAHLDPEILVVDEVLAVGDVEFQKRCLDRMAEVAKEGRTILFVSHNMNIVRRLCAGGMLLDGGRLITSGDINHVVTTYLTSIEPDEGGRRTWERSVGPGDSAFSLAAIQVAEEDSEPRTTFFTSKPIYVSLEFDVDELNPGLMIAIEIASADGSVVFFTSFRDMPEDAVPQLERGRNALRCEIPAELLNAGRYAINVRVLIQGARWIVYEDAILHFDTILDHGSSLFFTSGAARSGVVVPAIKWAAVEPRTASTQLLSRS